MSQASTYVDVMGKLCHAGMEGVQENFDTLLVAGVWKRQFACMPKKGMV